MQTWQEEGRWPHLDGVMLPASALKRIHLYLYVVL